MAPLILEMTNQAELCVENRLDCKKNIFDELIILLN